MNADVTKISDIFRFPIKQKGVFLKVIIGGILSVLPFFHFLGIGYVMTIIKEAQEGKERSLPCWSAGNLFKYLKLGFMAFVIMAILSAPIFLILLISILFIFGLNLPFVGIMFILSAIVMMLLFAFILPFIIARYLDKEELKAVAELPEIFMSIKNAGKTYIIGYFTILLIIVGIAVILGSFFPPLIAIILGIFPIFYVGMVGARFIGELYIRGSK